MYEGTHKWLCEWELPKSRLFLFEEAGCEVLELLLLLLPPTLLVRSLADRLILSTSSVNTKLFPLLY
jgi:hypothetical protein